MIETHFTERAAARGLSGFGYDLQFDLAMAISDPIRWHEFVEPVMPAPGGAHIWRFRAVPDEFHYAVACANPERPHGVAVMTVLTEEMMQAYKIGRRKKSKKKQRRQA